MSHPLPFPYCVALLTLAKENGGGFEIESPASCDNYTARFRCSDGVYYTATANQIDRAAELVYAQMIHDDYITADNYPVFSEILTVMDAAHRETINGQNYGVCRKCGRPITAPDETLAFNGTNDIYDCCGGCAKIITNILNGLENNPPLEDTDIREIADFAVDVFFTPGADYNPIEFA